MIGLIITVIGSTWKFSKRFSDLERKMERLLARSEDMERRVLTLETKSNAVGDLRDRITRMETLCTETRNAYRSANS